MFKYNILVYLSYVIGIPNIIATALSLLRYVSSSWSRKFTIELKGSAKPYSSPSADRYYRYAKIDNGTFVIYEYGKLFYKLKLQADKNVYIIRTTLNSDDQRFFTNEKWFIEGDKLNNPNTKKTKHNKKIINTYSKIGCNDF